jgi:Sulfotransferase family
MTRTNGNGAVAARIGDVVGKASSETGLDDFGADTWREGLEVLIRAAVTEAKFNDFGEQAFYSSLVRSLANRLRIEDCYARHPEIDEQEVEIELLGVGFPRTGSTALSHMLALDRSCRSLRMWEELTPCPPPGMSQKDDDERIAVARAMVEAGQSVMADRLRSMLPQSATGPMEDHDLMALEFKAQIFLVSGRIPSYAEWFVHCDMEPTYRYERRVLKLLQWKTPERRWRLKSPTHTMFLEDFEKVFPEARFVQTHRDVAKVLPSVSDLYYTMLQAGTPDIDPIYVGELNMEQWGIAVDRSMTFRQSPARNAKFFDVGFNEFQADPVGQIRRLYDWLGDRLTDESVERMLRWRAENPRDKHGRHEYDGAPFGLTDTALRRRFSPYLRRFADYLG